MRVRRQTATALWRAWLVALALTLGYAAIATTMPGRRPVPSAGVRLLRIAPARVAVPPPPLPTDEAALFRPGPMPATKLDVAAAPPFSLGRAGTPDRARALRCLADAVYYEAAGEPEAGQRGVAQVVLNRVRHSAYPATVCGVVYQGAPGRGCQFSFACDGSLARVPSAIGWAHAARIAAAALAGRVEPAVGLATYYHTYAVAPAWNRGMVMTAAIGAHFFHRWAGDLGTAAAFGRRYRGGEPALPLPVLTTPAFTTAPSGVAAITPIPAPPPLALQQPPVAPNDRLPPAATVLPRWRDSGKPL